MLMITTKGEPVSLLVHPALSTYLLKLEMTESVDHDYYLPKEDLTSSAVYPPMLSIKLESRQGYPQVINIEASDCSQGFGVTVQDVLRTIHENLRMPVLTHELSRLGVRGWSDSRLITRSVDDPLHVVLIRLRFTPLQIPLAGR
jgi:hypothetical protein